MNLIYICVFHQTNYINLLKLLITSISSKANIDKDNTEILILTSPSFEPIIKNELKSFDLPLYYYLLDLETLFDAGCARLNIFKYTNINKYNNILYLDTDILVNSDINILFNLEICEEKIYTLEEGHIGGEYWGWQFFDFSKYDKNTPAFISGILLFKNSVSIKLLFDDIQTHIDSFISDKLKERPLENNYYNFVFGDQPFIVYNAISQNKYDNIILKTYAENNPSVVSSEKILYHFPGNPGHYESKTAKMTTMWHMINLIPKET
jgi:lipopolysaccharide biosynthesis glycosyltransferase